MTADVGKVIAHWIMSESDRWDLDDGGDEAAADLLATLEKNGLTLAAASRAASAPGGQGGWLPAMTTLIAEEIVRQGNEIDNLGDCESIVLMGTTPIINLVQLAEAMLAASPTPVRSPAPAVLACGCVLGRERCFDCRPGLHSDQETALAISMSKADPKALPAPQPAGNEAQAQGDMELEREFTQAEDIEFPLGMADVRSSLKRSGELIEIACNSIATLEAEREELRAELDRCREALRWVRGKGGTSEVHEYIDAALAPKERADGSHRGGGG